MFPLAIFIAIALQQPQPSPPAAPPKFGAVGIHGAIDGAGYSAPAAEKAQSRFIRDLVRLASRQPCPRSPAQNAFAQGVAVYAQGQTDKARLLFKQGLAAYPHSTLLAIGYGALLYSDGYSAEARDTFLQAAKADPTSPEPFSFLASLAAIPGAIDPTTLASFVTRNPRAKFAYAQSLITAGSGQQAEPLLEQVTAADPTIAEAHFQLAVLYARQDDPQKAIAEYRRVLQIDPTLTEAHYRLGQLYLHTGQKQEGEKELRTPVVPPQLRVVSCP